LAWNWDVASGRRDLDCQSRSVQRQAWISAKESASQVTSGKVLLRESCRRVFA